MTQENPSTTSPPKTRHFFEGITLLKAGQLPEAIKAFRQAVRHAPPPWGDHAQVALGQCHMALGKEGAALRSWESVATDQRADLAARWMALLCLQARHESRGETKRAAQVQAMRLELDGPWRTAQGE